MTSPATPNLAAALKASLSRPQPAGTLPAGAIEAALGAYRRTYLTKNQSNRFTERVVTAALDAAAPALRAQGAAAERAKFLAVLAEHYLAFMICNHDTRQDNPVCGCSSVFLGWHPTVGEAVQAWIGHVADLLDAE